MRICKVCKRERETEDSIACLKFDVCCTCEIKPRHGKIIGIFDDVSRYSLVGGPPWIDFLLAFGALVLAIYFLK